MFCQLQSKRGQSTLEYAVLIIIIIAAILTIQNYVKRGIQGRMKSSADDIGDQFQGNYVKYTNTASRTKQRTVNGESTTNTEFESINSSYQTDIDNKNEYWGNDGES